MRHHAAGNDIVRMDGQAIAQPPRHADEPKTGVRFTAMVRAVDRWRSGSHRRRVHSYRRRACRDLLHRGLDRRARVGAGRSRARTAAGCARRSPSTASERITSRTIGVISGGRAWILRRNRRTFQPTSGSSRVQNGRGRSRTRGAVLPVRPLPADLEQPSGQHAGEPPGHLERLARAVVGLQVHDQHQHRDELLAGGGRRTSRSCTRRCSICRQRARRRPARRARRCMARAASSSITTPTCGVTPCRSTSRDRGSGRWAAPGCRCTSGIITTTRATASSSPIERIR